MLDLRDLRKTYKTAAGPVTALDGVSLGVERGDVFGVIGRSGAGKTTLIRAANLLERPDSGTVHVGGQDLLALDRPALNAARRKIGMIFQHFNLLSSRTVFDNVALPLEIAGAAPAEIARRVPALLDTVGLAEKARAYPAALSGGQKQRVGIARALATEPQVLLCDEATSALDPETTRSILALLTRINREFGLTILLITHEMEVIRQVARHVAVMERGRIVEQGPVYDVFVKPQTATARSFAASLTHTAPPAPIAARLVAEPVAGGIAVLRLLFVGEHATEPLLTRAARHFGIDINVLSGQVDEIGGRPFGAMVVSVPAAGEQRAALLAFFIEHGIAVEELGYVPGALRAAG